MSHHEQSRSVLSIAALLADADSVEPLVASDGKSGVTMERAIIHGEPFVVKYLSLADDWIMRITEDHGFRPLQLWESGVHDQLPACIDDAVVAIGLDDPQDDRTTARLAILMADMSAWLVPEGDDMVPVDQHRTFVAHMAELHASFWEWHDDLDMLPLATRYLWFAPRSLAPELERDDCAEPVRLASVGWERLAERDPELSATVWKLHADPTPLVRAVRRTPQTLLHGDWKMGNLGSEPGGRTVLIDWALSGSGPACADLVHYLSLNRARLPESKESAIDLYRTALERCGIDTAPWWDRQRSLSLLGGMVQFGWEKALGDGDEADAELAWWSREAEAGTRWLN